MHERMYKKSNGNDLDFGFSLLGDRDDKKPFFFQNYL